MMKILTNALLFFLITECLFISKSSANTVANSDHFQQEILSIHNRLRADHQAPKLIWDATLADYALQHASSCKFKHSYGKYGENLAAGYRSVNAALTDWYDENTSYHYWHPGFSMSTGHFTQMVWKSSRKIGCAMVACDGRNGTPGNFLICEYSPHGNVTNRGYFAENVLPKK